MISCRDVTELVTEYAEGRMAFLDRLRFQLHLGMCRSCRRYVRQMKATARALGRLPPPEMPAGLRDELLRRFDGWKGSGRQREPGRDPGRRPGDG